MLETGLELSANLPEISKLLARASRLRTRDWGIFLPERENTDTQYTVIFYHLQSALRGAQRRR